MESGLGSNRFLVALLSVFALFCETRCSYADNPPSPYRSEMELQGFYDLKAVSDGRGEREIIPTLRIAGRLRTEGRIDARFTVRKNKTWTSSVRHAGRERRDSIDPILLQGKLAVGGGYRLHGKRIMPTAASIIGRELKVTFAGRARGLQRTRQRIYTIRVNLDGSMRVSARVTSIPRNAFQRGACAAPIASLTGETQGEPRITAALETGEALTETRKVLTISTDADPEWYSKYGENSNAEIASIINAAEVIYQRQLGVNFRLVRQHVYTDQSPYTTTSSGALLTAFSENPENVTNLGDGSSQFDDVVDLKHLFTGRDLDGSVIGIAYIGAVCVAPQYSYGVTQSYVAGATMGIFAHEIGHNLGGFHDVSDVNGLMYPSVRVPPAEQFSTASVAEISSHLQTYDSCVSHESVKASPAPSPSPSPTAVPEPQSPQVPDLANASLTIRARAAAVNGTPLVRISGNLRSSSAAPLSNQAVYLVAKGEPVGAAVTDSSGAYQFFVRVTLRRGRFLGLFAQTEGGELRSRTIRVSRALTLRLRR